MKKKKHLRLRCYIRDIKITRTKIKKETDSKNNSSTLWVVSLIRFTDE